MFERYTERARRVIFFARYEASQFGSTTIETEHLLLGLIREDKNLTNRFLRNHSSIESIRKEIEGRTTIREKVSTSIDLPLSNECKRILAYAAEEAEALLEKYAPPVIHIDPAFCAQVAGRASAADSRLWANSLGGRDRLASLGMGKFAFGKLLRGGATVIQTDVPEKLLAYLKKHGRAVER